MSVNGNGHDAPRILRAHDLVSGEALLLVYFPKAGAITINGYSVTQIPGLTGRAGQSIFHQAPGDREYIVATDLVAKLYT